VDYRGYLDSEFEVPGFQHEHNPFAYSPEQLAKLHDPKNMDVLRAMGGMFGLVFGLRTHIHEGLSPDETALENPVTFLDVCHAVEEQGRLRGTANPTKEPDARSSFTEAVPMFFELQSDGTKQARQPRIRSLSQVGRTILMGSQPSARAFDDRRRIFSANRIPSRKPKNIFQLMWFALHDRILV
jgi:Ca2+-transporting ATPase